MSTAAEDTTRPVVLVAPDKFRGSLTAPEVVDAARAAAEGAGWEVIGMPMADGGEGMLDAFGGANRTSTVTGPLGDPVRAAWRLGDDGVAVVESAAASGLVLAGGKQDNDPVGATSAGTGELVAEAVRAGATRIIVGLGGSAMSDGGLGAVVAARAGLDGRTPAELGVELLAACDVQTPFVEAAQVFGPQKGADADQVIELTGRLFVLQGRYVEEFGVDVSATPGAGAAGGLGGGLLVLGGSLVPGLRLVAEQLGLADAVARADAIVTGEGALDAESFNGKVVGGVVDEAEPYGIPVVVVAGIVREDAPAVRLSGLRVVDLSETFGANASWNDTASCIRRAVAEQLSTLS
ncbi:glycerate kinase family protein [Serinicoccus kebangsaanensis]|uniref:glycerate kinase family protein n=1 Tax=Serinicoccus kebangsaanensis TaxID=2602069 RepID=UPI00124D521F|nr:glycerate kinase [Serinicoccus kebangsaanensis]